MHPKFIGMALFQPRIAQHRPNGKTAAEFGVSKKKLPLILNARKQFFIQFI